MSNLCENIIYYDNFRVIPNVINEQEVQELLKYWNGITIGVSVNINNWDVHSTTKTKIQASNRNVEIIGIPNNKFVFLTEKLIECFSCFIEDPSLESPHYFTYYPVGGKHTRHRDSSSEFNRDLVLTLFLNDDFQGGELIINGETAPVKKYSAIIYDGNLFHEVKSVTFGERFVITECAGKKLK
jgi:predicted 2-oxoglutarate/Fe(II)-dependent dioxygenase YbiX